MHFIYDYETFHRKMQRKNKTIMQGNWILKIYPKQYQINKVKKICRKKTKKENYYTYVNKPKKEIKRLQKENIRYSCYRVEYERASNYRQTFFQRTEGPYRCRYCNKKLPKDKVFVDHIIPVAKTQKSKTARLMLAVRRCGNVNDIRNLAPACRSCNSKKSDKMGIWIIRGWLGKYKIYWVLLRILQILCICLILFGIFDLILAIRYQFFWYPGMH